jgi:hypothetical protein
VATHTLEDLRVHRLSKLVQTLAGDLKAFKEQSQQTKLHFEKLLHGERVRLKLELDLAHRERDELAIKLEKATQELESLKKQLLSGWGSEKKPNVKLNATQLWFEGFGTNIPLEDLPPEPPEKEIKAHKRAIPRRSSKDGESRFSDEAQIVEIRDPESSCRGDPRERT